MTSDRTPESLVQLLNELMPGTHSSWDVVQEKGRSVVLRARGLIAKCAVERATFESERYGLESVARYCPSLGPGLIATFDEHNIVVMENLGSGPSLADALIGPDVEEAVRALDEYVVALAALHEESSGHSGHEDTAEPRWLAELVARARNALRNDVPSGVLAMDDHCEAALDDALGRIFAPGSRAVFSFGDMCPDNNVRTASGMRFFDLEAAGFVDPALDLANLVMPFPTCWCCFDLPQDVRDAAVAKYLSLRSDESEAGLGSAISVLTVVTLGLTALRVADEDDGDDLDGLVLPTGRQRVLHRLLRAHDLLGDTGEYPQLRAWFDESLARLHETWPEAEPLGVAPAFRSAD